MPSKSGRRRRANVLAKGDLQKHHRTAAKSGDRKIGSNSAVDEIKASIAVRDSLLVEAEETPTIATLRRALIANEFVETCLKPARRPYAAQHLAEADAIIERKRCAAVKRRIAELRANVAAH